MQKINILGSEWSLDYRTIKEDVKLNEMDGYTDYSSRLIVVDKFEPELMSEDDIAKSQGNLKEHQKQVLRHEIVHAFLYESGLSNSSYSPRHWAASEEIVDWIAAQTPKMFKLYKELDIL